MSQPARPGAARAPSARDRPAPAHPQHRSPARRRITTAGLTPQQPMTAASPAATGPTATRSAATATRPLPVLALEPTGRQRTMLPAGVVAFDRLEGGADPVAQRGEPYRGALLTLRIG